MNQSQNDIEQIKAIKNKLEEYFNVPSNNPNITQTFNYINKYAPRDKKLLYADIGNFIQKIWVHLQEIYQLHGQLIQNHDTIESIETLLKNCKNEVRGGATRQEIDEIKNIVRELGYEDFIKTVNKILGFHEPDKLRKYKSSLLNQKAQQENYFENIYGQLQSCNQPSSEPISESTSSSAITENTAITELSTDGGARLLKRSSDKVCIGNKTHIVYLTSNNTKVVKMNGKIVDLKEAKKLKKKDRKKK